MDLKAIENKLVKAQEIVLKVIIVRGFIDEFEFVFLIIIYNNIIYENL